MFFLFLNGQIPNKDHKCLSEVFSSSCCMQLPCNLRICGNCKQTSLNIICLLLERSVFKKCGICKIVGLMDKNIMILSNDYVHALVVEV